MIRLEEAKTHLNNINRGNATLWANVNDQDPRTGNATITAQYTDRCVSARIYRDNTYLLLTYTRDG